MPSRMGDVGDLEASFQIADVDCARRGLIVPSRISPRTSLATMSGTEAAALLGIPAADNAHHISPALERSRGA